MAHQLRFRSAASLTAVAAASLLAMLVVGTAEAHIVKSFGSYSVALGWAHEPTYVGAANAVQVIVKDAKGAPVTDIPDGDLTVVVSVSGQSSSALSLDNAFDSDTGLGIPGDYEASITPTVPGDYTFHLTGAIHGTTVDETATSSDATFNSVVDSSTVDFPTKLPSISDIVTRLDRIDARTSAAPAPSAAPAASAAPGQDAAAAAQSAQSAADAASAAAAAAQSDASTALQVGVLVGAIGIVLGAVALFLAVRRRPGPA
jgi:hypothetical protein